MNYIKHLSGFFNKIVDDHDMNPTHVSLYMALFQFWNLNRFQNPISITRNEMMRISKIFSKATYHKCVNELHGKGYIRYEPSHNPFKGSLVWVVSLEDSMLTKSKKEMRRLNDKQVNEPVREPVREPAIEQVVDNLQTSDKLSSRQVLVPSINNTNNTNALKIENGNTRPNENSNEFEKIEKSNELEKKKKKLREKKEIDFAKMIPPNLEHVQNFFEEMSVGGHEAERFYNHFQSNGWLVGGKSKMKNWHASARNWIMNLNKFKPIHQVSMSVPEPGNLKTTNQKKYDEPL
jgi:hypothetical protein